MNEDQFSEQILATPELAESFKSAQFEYYGTDRRGATEAVFLFMMYPAVKYLLTEIGLPWLALGKDLSDAIIEKIRKKLLPEYETMGVDSNKVTQATKVFYEDLAKIEDKILQKKWEEVFSSLVE